MWSRESRSRPSSFLQHKAESEILHFNLLLALSAKHCFACPQLFIESSTAGTGEILPLQSLETKICKGKHRFRFMVRGCLFRTWSPQTCHQAASPLWLFSPAQATISWEKMTHPADLTKSTCSNSALISCIRVACSCVMPAQSATGRTVAWIVNQIWKPLTVQQ